MSQHTKRPAHAASSRLLENASILVGLSNCGVWRLDQKEIISIYVMAVPYEHVTRKVRHADCMLEPLYNTSCTPFGQL